MANDDALREKVRIWLRSEGYPLEMQAAAKFRQVGFEVRQGQHFVDPETAKSREIDLLCIADDERGIASFRLVVECKTSANAWIVFTSEHVLQGYNRFAAFAVASSAARKALVEVGKFTDASTLEKIMERMFAHYGKIEGAGGLFEYLAWFSKRGRIGYSAAVAFVKNGSEIPYAATVGVLKAALSEEKSAEAAPATPFCVVFPVLVIDAPLLECYLDADGDMTLKPILECELAFFGTIAGESPTACVRVVSLGGLDSFASAAAREIQKLKVLLEPAIDRDWKMFLEKTDRRLRGSE